VSRGAAGSVRRLLSLQTLPTQAARAAVGVTAPTVTVGRATGSKRAALTLRAAVIGTATSIGGNGRAVDAVTRARVEVD
jgi:hypothetical protein